MPEWLFSLKVIWRAMLLSFLYYFESVLYHAECLIQCNRCLKRVQLVSNWEIPYRVRAGRMTVGQCLFDV